MKKKQFEALVASMGAEWEVLNYERPRMAVFAPEGQVWVESGCSLLTLGTEREAGAFDWIRSELAQCMKCGLQDADT
jgi:hypothetical protein